MNKKEAQKRVEAAERELEAAKKALQESEELRVPESIGFVKDSLTERFWLTFNVGKSKLLYSVRNVGAPVVLTTRDTEIKASPKLVKVDKPEKGKWYFTCNGEDVESLIHDVYRYKLYTSDKEYWLIYDDDSMVRGANKFNHYYELQ